MNARERAALGVLAAFGGAAALIAGAPGWMVVGFFIVAGVLLISTLEGKE